jgi:hypothetical protein
MYILVYISILGKDPIQMSKPLISQARIGKYERLGQIDTVDA